MPTPLLARDTVPMDFFEALRKVATGSKITRTEWGNADVVFLHAERLHLRKTEGSLHQLLVSLGDLEATDWVVVREQ